MLPDIEDECKRNRILDQDGIRPVKQMSWIIMTMIYVNKPILRLILEILETGQGYIGFYNYNNGGGVLTGDVVNVDCGRGLSDSVYGRGVDDGWAGQSGGLVCESNGGSVGQSDGLGMGRFRGDSGGNAIENVDCRNGEQYGPGVGQCGRCIRSGTGDWRHQHSDDLWTECVTTDGPVTGVECPTPTPI